MGEVLGEERHESDAVNELCGARRFVRIVRAEEEEETVRRGI